MNGFVPLWPPAASAYADRIDGLFAAFSALAFLLTAPVFVLLVIFAVRYRQGRTVDRDQRPDRNVLLETGWAVVPFILTLGFFVYATKLYFDLGRPPPDALVIDVLAKQWMWKFEHPGGQREINVLHVPSDRPVRLVMISQDVIHSLYLPALRIKQDVLPGRYTSLWFDADRPGTYPLRCAEFCGLDHAGMGGRIVVMPPQDYARWLASADTDGSLASQGAALFDSLGCGGCHEPRGQRRAPDLAGIYRRPVTLSDGRTKIADQAYLRDSLLIPNRDIVAGYPPIMPSFSDLPESEVLRLVEYLKSLDSDGARR